MIDSETGFRLAVLAITLAGFAVGAYYRGRARAIGGPISRKPEGWILIPLRLTGLALYAALLGYLIDPSTLAWSRPALPEWLRWSGLGAGTLGVALAWWVLHHLGLNVTDTVATRPKHQLVTSGPYRHVRHPLYGAFALITAGYSLLTASVLVLGLGVLGAALLLARTSIEERKLLERFGIDYATYMSRTGRFVPSFPARARPERPERRGRAGGVEAGRSGPGSR